MDIYEHVDAECLAINTLILKRPAERAPELTCAKPGPPPVVLSCNTRHSRDEARKTITSQASQYTYITTDTSRRVDLPVVHRKWPRMGLYRDPRDDAVGAQRGMGARLSRETHIQRGCEEDRTSGDGGSPEAGRCVAAK